jgi:hypothetical protein
MLLPIALAIPFVASLACFLWFRNFAGEASYWLRAAKVAGAVAALRIGVVALGAYLLENTSGWLQLPGYGMALCGLPEIYFLPQRTWGTVAAVFTMSVLIIPGAAAWTFALAGLAARRAPHRSPNR